MLGLHDFVLPIMGRRAPHPKEQGLHMGPHLRMPTVLAENVSRVFLSVYLEESENSGNNGLSDTVVRKGIVALA